jgi:hypothetical protein
MAGKRDTRVFIYSPFPADFDYDGLRAFDTSFSFTLSNKFNYTGRDVQHRGRRFELWSPNSSRLPVYPGLSPADFNMTPPLRYPRTDGSGGRFDWTLHPQYFDANRLHLPFIMTPESAVSSQHLPEFTYLTSQWNDHPMPAQTTGTLSREYIASLCSRAASLEEQRVAVVGDIPTSWDFLKCLVSEAPTTETLTKFGLGMEWGECVSQVTAVQRQLREKQAWLQMLRALRSTNWGINISPITDDIGAAHEYYMGCWVNGASEKLIRWLLYLGIPCFIIHEYRVGEDFGDGIHEYRSRHVSQSFCPPFVWHLREEINAYSYVARKNGTSFATADQLVIGSSVSASASALARSASHFHGYIRAEEDISAITPDEGSIDWPVLILFPDRIPWVKPPPISATPQTKGKWARFVETTLEDDGSPLGGCTVMQERGASFRGLDNWRGPYFDRHHKRQLYFEELDSVPGLVSDPKFGRPVPYYKFVRMPVGNKPPALTTRSTWMYDKLNAIPADIGLNAHPPLPAVLPRFTEEDDINPEALPPSTPPSTIGLAFTNGPMIVEGNASQLPIFSTNESSTPLQPSPSEAHPLPSALEVSVQSPSGTQPLRSLTPPASSSATEPSYVFHRVHSLPPRPSLHTHDIEGSGSDTCHDVSIELNLDSCQMIPAQSTIKPILSYKKLCHEPCSSRSVVLSGIGLGTTAAEIAASLRKPIMPGPGCNVFVRASSRCIRRRVGGFCD